MRVEAVDTANGPRHSRPNGVATKLLTITFDGIIRAGCLIVTAGLIRGSGHGVGRIGLGCNDGLVKHCLREMFPRPKWLVAEVPLVDMLLHMDNRMHHHEKVLNAVVKGQATFLEHFAAHTPTIQLCEGVFRPAPNEIVAIISPSIRGGFVFWVWGTLLMWQVVVAEHCDELNLVSPA